jgi:acyl-CoA thioesterase-1
MRQAVGNKVVNLKRRLGAKRAGQFALAVLLHCSLGLSNTAAWADSTPSTPGKPARQVLVLGDSLSAEYGLVRGTGWVPLLQQRLSQQAPGWQVFNASISGDTTSGGRSRLPALLKQHQPQVLVIELGGNDALRGLPLTSTRDNLQAMTRAAQAAGAKVLLLGMQVPPNYGTRYGQEFSQLFADVARSERAALLPFFLQGIADGPDALALFQPDHIHPKAQAQAMLLDNVWPQLKPLLR